MGINIDVFEAMLCNADEKTRKSIIFNINCLLAYSDFVSKLEDTIKSFSNSPYMMKKLDQDR